MKELFFNKELTTEIYLMLVSYRGYQKKLAKVDEHLLVNGLLSHEEFEESKRRLQLIEKLLDFFRFANEVTLIDKLPF